jgi:hypothetical protein
MLIKNIPESTLSLVGTGVGLGNLHIQHVEILPQPATLLQALFGNGCGHHPKQLREYNRPLHHKPRPSILEQAIKNAAQYYHAPKKFLKNLNTLHPQNRRKRSERREAITSVLQVLLHYIELMSLKVGINTPASEVICFDIHFIADKAGIEPIRARRAMKDLVKAGYLKISRQWTRKDDGDYIGLPSLREFTLEFFHDLGIDLLRLASTREWKRKKEEKAQGRRGRHRLKRIIATVSALSGSKAINPINSILSKFYKPPSTTDSSKKQAHIRQALELHKANPAISISDYYRLLQKNE